MSTVQTVTMDFAGRPLSIETGRLAKQADASALVRYGDTMVLVTVVISPEPVDADFLPLRVDFEEKMYAVGRIPGGFFKREGRPSEEAVLTCRRIDRPIRPLLPAGLRNEVQVIAIPMSAETQDSVDLAALIGASAALHLSPVPFEGPFGAAQIGIVGGELTLNPSFEQLEESDLNLLLVATRNGIVMVEFEGNSVPEDLLLQATVMAEEACQPVVEIIEELREKAGKPKGDYPIWQPRPEIAQQVRERAYDRICQAVEELNKTRRKQMLDDITDELVAALEGQYPDAERDVKAVIEDLIKERVRRIVLDEKRRVDGRALDELRPITCEVGLLPRAHGSSLFTRGETQVATITTLGAVYDQRMVRTLEEEDYSRFMHHYNFPPFCVGETRALRGPGRREIGHGHLAQKALESVLPAEEEFPYTIRLVSEVLESNGSSSMASVCASSLSLMDAGVPIKKAVAGVSIGLIYEGPDRYATLTDIQGLEDHAGHMDFKVAGTRDGINALHLDMKVQGLPTAVLEQALEQAKRARLQILDIMDQVLSAPRPHLSAYAPRMHCIKIDPEKIGLLIGPGGRTIRGLQDKYDVEIDVADDGTVTVFGRDGEKVQQCHDAIDEMMRDIQVGEVYNAKVISTVPFGAFVELLPGREALLHISHLAWEHVNKTEDVLKVGDEIPVKVIEVDDDGKVRVSRKELLPRPTAGGGKGGHGSGNNHKPRGKKRDHSNPGGARPETQGRPYLRDKKRN